MQNAGVVAMVQGAAKSGKTRFLQFALKQENLKSYQPTVEDDFVVTEPVGGQGISLTYMDTGGEESCEDMISDWVRRAHFQIFFINLEQPSSLEYLRLKTTILEKRDLIGSGGMLVGNLPSGNAANRKVSRQEALNLAASFTWAEFSYVETNTATGEGVDAAVSTLIECLEKCSGAEKRGDESKKNAGFSQTFQTWLEQLGISKEGADAVLQKVLSWGELEAMFGSDIQVVKTELHSYGMHKPSDRNKLIAGWKTRENRTKQDELERLALLEAQKQQLEAQLRAANARIEALEAQMKVATARLEVVEAQQSEPSLTHRIQEVMLKHLQAIGLARKEGPPDLTIPGKTRTPSPEETTPVKGKPVQVRVVGRPKPPPGRGGLFSTSLK